MYQEDGSEEGPRGTFETYRAEGESLYKNGEYRKAIDSFTTALELQQNDKNCLVARSRCYLQLGDTDNALKDAELSLKEDKEFHKGLYQKAEALYCKGEFELALVFYHRGHKLRPELHEFRLGIQKAQEAIDNSVGSPEKVKLTKEGDLSFFEKQDEKKPKPKYQSYNRPPTRQQTVVRREVSKSAQNDKTIKQLLGELYGDKIYLEKLLRETDPNTESGRNIYELVCEGLHYLDTRTDFWRQQKPMYARKRDTKLQRDRAASSNKTQPNEYIIKELEKIDEAQSEGKFKDSLARAKKCLKTVEGYQDGTISNKEDVMANLYSQIGNAYLEMGEHDKALSFHKKDLNLAEKHNLEDAKSRALDNLGRSYARKGDFQPAIDCWTNKLPLTRSALESTWLYHEIGRCHLELGNHEEAREFGEKSSAAAQEADDDMWQLNATVLMAQAEVKLADLNSALSSFEKALEMAKLQGDAAAEAAIRKAIDDVNTKLADEAHKNKEEDKGEDEKSVEDTEEAAEEKEEEEEEQTQEQEKETNNEEDKDNNNEEDKEGDNEEENKEE